MCINSLMIDTDIIQCLLEDLLDRICSNSLKYSPIYYSSQSIENKFNQSINILNNSLKQLLTYELNTVVNNGQLTPTSNIRQSRYYNPATTIKQTNDLKKRLQWIEQRQIIIKQLNLNQEKKLNETNCDLHSTEQIWFNQRLKMLNNSLELIKKDEEEINEINDDLTCSRCRIYQRKKPNETKLFKKIKQFNQIHNEHNYSNIHLQYSTSESDLIISLSKIADRIGYNSNSNLSNSSKKLSTTTTTMIKKKPPKLQSSISLIVGGDSNKNSKRSMDESKLISNSNYDLTNKRQKRIASPQSTLSVSSINTTTSNSGLISSSSPHHEILTPTWRILTNNDFEKNSSDQQENEDISDECYIHRHIRCELEQETWLTNTSISNRKNSTTTTTTTLQTSLSVPNGLSTKQYRYHLTPNGIAYTETLDTK